MTQLSRGSKKEQESQFQPYSECSSQRKGPEFRLQQFMLCLKLFKGKKDKNNYWQIKLIIGSILSQNGNTLGTSSHWIQNNYPLYVVPECEKARQQ